MDTFLVFFWVTALPVVPPPVTKEPTAPPPSGGGELGEDMLQMALRMASEMTDEPVMDLENSLEPVAVSSGMLKTNLPARYLEPVAVSSGIPKKSLSQIQDTVLSLYNAMFGVHRNGLCFK